MRDALRFDYSTHKTRESAERALERYFATGEVCEGEHPEVEKRVTGHFAKKYAG